MKAKKKVRLTELEQIKRLLILQLLRDGATAVEIGIAMGVTQQRVSQIFPVRKLKKSKKGGQEDER